MLRFVFALAVSLMLTSCTATSGTPVPATPLATSTSSSAEATQDCDPKTEPSGDVLYNLNILPIENCYSVTIDSGDLRLADCSYSIGKVTYNQAMLEDLRINHRLGRDEHTVIGTFHINATADYIAITWRGTKPISVAVNQAQWGLPGVRIDTGTLPFTSFLWNRDWADLAGTKGNPITHLAICA